MFATWEEMHEHLQQSTGVPRHVWFLDMGLEIDDRDLTALRGGDPESTPMRAIVSLAERLVPGARLQLTGSTAEGRFHARLLDDVGIELADGVHEIPETAVALAMCQRMIETGEDTRLPGRDPLDRSLRGDPT